LAGVDWPGRPLVLRSYMPEHGVLFSDGLEQNYLSFNAGAVVTVGVAARKAQMAYTPSQEEN